MGPPAAETQSDHVSQLNGSDSIGSYIPDRTRSASVLSSGILHSENRPLA